MSKLRRQLSSGTVNIVETRNLNDIKDKTGNLYESISIVGKRANQINISLKEELKKNFKNFPAKMIILKKFIRIKNRSKFREHTKECLTLLCWLPRNFSRRRFTS